MTTNVLATNLLSPIPFNLADVQVVRGDKYV